jgi:hypothetical protein
MLVGSRITTSSFFLAPHAWSTNPDGYHQAKRRHSAEIRERRVTLYILMVSVLVSILNRLFYSFKGSSIAGVALTILQITDSGEQVTVHSENFVS